MQYTINTLDQIKPILVGYRKRKGLSQKDLAKKLGVSQQSYQALEANPQNATLERLFKVFTLLGVKLQFVDMIISQSQADNTQSDDEDSW